MDFAPSSPISLEDRLHTKRAKTKPSKKTKYQKDQISAKELTDLLNEQKSINKKLSKKYFEIKEKEFNRLKSGDPLDREIPYALRIDDATGEKVPVTITAREAFEQAAKDETMLNRLKDCV